MVSELTKRIVAQQKGQLAARIVGNTKHVEEYVAIIAQMEAENASLQTSIDALTADIPAPEVT